MSRRGWLLFLAMGVIWGVPYLLIKVAVHDLAPAMLVFLRTAAAALLLVPLAIRGGQWRSLLPAWRPLLAYTAVEIAIPWLLLSDAERRLSSSLSGLLIAAVPLVGALMSWLARDRDRLDSRRVVGLLVGLSGVAAVLGVNLHGGTVRSLLEMLGVVVGYAIGPRLIARQLADLPSLGVVAASLAVCAVVYTPAAFLQEPAHVPLRVIGAVAGLAVVCTALAFLLFFRLVAEVGPVRATVITYVNPAVAVVLGVAVLGERFTVGTGVGFALILLGSYLSTRRVRERPAADSPESVAGYPSRV